MVKAARFRYNTGLLCSSAGGIEERKIVRRNLMVYEEIAGTCRGASVQLVIVTLEIRLGNLPLAKGLIKYGDIVNGTTLNFNPPDV